MESDSGKRAKESGVRYRRYSIRHTFAAEGEMLELESGRAARLDWMITKPITLCRLLAYMFLPRFVPF